MRRHPLGQRGRRGADEPAAGEDVEGARPLADEVRRRLEAGRVRDATAREKGHGVRPEKPRGSFGGVAGVRVLGQQNEQAASELLVERCQNERKRRLRDTRATGQRLRECLEPFAAGELRDEGVKGCLVHAKSGKCVPRAHPSAPDPAVVARLEPGTRCPAASLFEAPPLLEAPPGPSSDSASPLQTPSRSAPTSPRGALSRP